MTRDTDDLFHGSSIETYSGIHVTPLDPKPEMICLGDIAHALSQQCRFAGHCKKFYSVAEHCVHVSHLVPSDFAKVALLHDAGEAYLMDIPRPLKKHMGFSMDGHFMPYRAFEERLMEIIAAHFGMQWAGMPPEVRAVDDRMLVTEYLAFVNEDKPGWTAGVEPYVRALGGLAPKDAEKAFLDRAHAVGVYEVR
jgi:hypothetical protein